MGTIRENLEAIKKQFSDQTGFLGPYTIYLSSKMIIEMHKRGLLNLRDETVKIFVTDSKIEEVEAYIRENI